MQALKLKATVVNFREGAGGQRSSPLLSVSGQVPRTPANGMETRRSIASQQLTAGLLHALPDIATLRRDETLFTISAFFRTPGGPSLCCRAHCEPAWHSR